jgi:hypothetical protein
MPKKTRQRWETPTQAANDNKLNAKMVRFAWDVYRAAARARYVGRVIASTDREAIETAAVEFRTEAWKLIPVQRWEVAS